MAEVQCAGVVGAGQGRAGGHRHLALALTHTASPSKCPFQILVMQLGGKGKKETEWQMLTSADGDQVWTKVRGASCLG